MPDNQTSLELETNDWKKEWVGMPEYKNVVQKPPMITATFKFRSQEDFDEFNRLARAYLYGGARVFDGMQKKTVKTTWYPLNEKAGKYRYL